MACFIVPGCNCSAAGAEGNACDIRSGQCRCRPHVTGRACDTCEEGYWGLELGGCRRCACGAGAAACDPVSGACACAAGVGGARCDTCLPGYYGFGPTGCLQCPACPEGRVCSAATGRCVCAGRARGPNCTLCARGYWRRGHACVPCACGPGAVSDTCDAVTGQCRCRAGWAGLACEGCAPGHFGPRCRPCNCVPAGTRGCKDGVCPCDQAGQCLCKENVVGEKCDSCLEGTFGLAEDNPAGCTACFCFGRSARCTQADVTRAALHASAPVHLKLLRGEAVTTVEAESQLAVQARSPDATIAVPRPAVPVYVELGELFLGDHLLSYGGALRFRVEEEGGEPLPGHTLMKFPLVSIYGAHLILDYYQRVPAVNGTHAVRLHESLWTVRGRGAGASRSALMLVLQDVRRVLLRASTRAPARADPVHVLLLSASLETAVAGVARGAAAPGVERCDCPRGYDAASCQLPAVGFWMPSSSPRVMHVSGTVVIRLDGAAEPCNCRGRASACHPNTGHCMNCSNNTAGPQCERCADGYYGSPESGCAPCPCPGPQRSHAAACAVSGSRVHCFCKPGYTGAACESCAAGWRWSGDSCVACACDPRGALDSRCDGGAHCRCRPHATGDRCQLCTRPRHYLDDDGCKPCDNCTQTLLDYVGEVNGDMRRRVDIAELSRAPQPFPALREFASDASALHNDLQQHRTLLEKTRLVESELGKLEVAEHELFTEANKFKEEIKRREKEALSLSLESMSGLEVVLNQKRMIADRVAALDDFAQGEKHLSAHRALKEARHLLKKIKSTSLIDYVAAATDISDSATMQSTVVREYAWRAADALERAQGLREGVARWEARGEELAQLASAVWAAGDRVDALRRDTVPRLAALRDGGTRCRLELENVASLSSHNLTTDARAALLNAQNLAIGFPALLAELRALTAAAEEKEGILYNITPAYKEKYLDAVEKHAAVLAEKAKEYKNLFAGTRAAASSGVRAATAWAEVAESVRLAAAAADAAVIAVAAAAQMARGPHSLLHTADKEKRRSLQLKQRGEEVLEKAEDLRRSVESARRGTDAVSVGLRALGWRQRELATAADAATASVASSAAPATLKHATGQAERVFGVARALYDEAAETRRRVRYQLRRELAHLQRLGDTALGAAEEHVSQIRGNTLRGAEVSEALAAAAAARAREHAAAARSLGPAARDLRTRIQQAKDAAATISVSLTSAATGPGCARAYAAWGAPAATRASLAFSFDGAVRDGTLLYLPDQDGVRYMRLYVLEGRLRVRWDVGGGVHSLEHPEPLQATHDDADHSIYRVEIERVWGAVRLVVERGGAAAAAWSNGTAAGGAGGLLRAPRWWLGEPARPLPACVHALHADRTPVGLWAFAVQPADAKCTACTQRWWRGGRGEGLVWLNGAGYVALRRSGARVVDRRRFSLSFTFRTRDTDALLFMALDTVNNRSLSVWLSACRVVFRVQYAHARLDITAGAAGARYCDGRPAHVQATRLFTGLERGSLRVNGEETLGSPSPPVQAAAELPDLSAAHYWVGGVPPGTDAGALPGADTADVPALLGCFGALTVDREGYDLLDTHARQGVEAGCSSKPLRSAILDGSGYIELPSPAIKRKATIGLTFQTRSEAGLLLYRATNAHTNETEEDKNYLMMSLVKGELEVRARAGKGEVRVRVNGSALHDGRLHTVRLVRVHKQLEVWVDEARRGVGTLGGAALAARARGTYLGGVPPAVLPGAGVPPFVGTITDFVVDSTWIGLETAVEWDGARLGRADGELRPEPPAEPRALQATTEGDSFCSKTSSFTVEAGAVKFGDAAGSYAALRVPRAGPKPDFAVSLHFRTFATDGLLLLIPGSKTKPKHYSALMVKEGRLRLVVRGRKRRELTLPLFVSDGTWRPVSVRAGRRRAVLRCGEAVAAARAASLARAARIYVGGPPPPHLLPHVPPQILKLGGFVGCVRRVTVNGREEDLVGRGGAGAARVRQCFPHVERGAYFAGDAHAAWGAWRGEGDVRDVRLQFRALAPTGVLLAAAGVVLELRDGAVVVSGPEGREATVEAGGRACDGAWHSVRVRLARRPALALDAAPEERAPPALLPAAPPPTATTLYVGGLPEGAAELTEGRENFKGCIREVVVGEERREWAAMDALHNVLLDSCPVAQ
ncbi:laminin subunit alpha-3-like [Aricia agestis]|uniref:laminin subunit alpha-3-like n=1 Tax=Aricia agestis TaxID=91739 RepID=UPI001C203C28|nr:laminin subunit alpha-3-like [Aricia agestis]